MSAEQLTVDDVREHVALRERLNKRIDKLERLIMNPRTSAKDKKAYADELLDLLEELDEVNEILGIGDSGPH